jgi:hypothetical protein
MKTTSITQVWRSAAVATILPALAAVAGAPAACSSSTGTGPSDGGPDGSRDGATRHDATTKRDAGMKRDAGVQPGEDAGCFRADTGPLTDAEISLGFAVVNAHGCFTCHGGNLQGNNDGVVSTVDGGLAYPPNLTPDLATGLGCWTNAQIENAFLNGFDNDGQPICNPMPHFGHLMGEAGIDPTQATGVVEFLRSLPTIRNNVPSTPGCTLTWDGGPDTGVDAHHVPDAAKDAPIDAGRDAAQDVAHRPDAPSDAHPSPDAKEDAQRDGARDSSHDGARDAGHDGGRDGGRDASGDVKLDTGRDALQAPDAPPDSGHRDAARDAADARAEAATAG